MKNLIAVTMILAAMVSVEAKAMKCEVSRGEFRADCDYRAYTHGTQVDLYASNCQYSDDNGGPATYHISTLAQVHNNIWVLTTGAMQVVMTCDK